jgi:hopanoid biosynthesis associated protein HpnK
MAPEVNAAVEAAHQHGILTAASLMVTGSAAADAVALARRLPRLRIGLHVVLVEGVPALPAEKVPGLVGPDGRFRTDMAGLSFDIALRPAVRAQLRAEVEAQFRAYHGTGLTLDHVNAHKHFHLHPLIAREVIVVGRRFGLRALRVPYEPAAICAKAEPGRSGFPRYVTPWLRLLARRARRAGLRTPDAVFGLAWSGAMSAARLRRLIPNLRDGLSEIYFHPATCDSFAGSAPGYHYADELAALTDPDIIALTRGEDVVLGGFSDF